MRKGRELMNKPLIEAASGSFLGYAGKIKAGPDKKSIEGIYATSPCGEVLFVPLENIMSLGPDAVLVNTRSFRSENNQEEGSGANGLNGLPIVTLSGRSLGTIDDIVIDEGGSILGYEVTDGYLKDVVLGRRIIAGDSVLTYGDDAAILDDQGGKRED